MGYTETTTTETTTTITELDNEIVETTDTTTTITTSGDPVSTENVTTPASTETTETTTTITERDNEIVETTETTTTTTTTTTSDDPVSTENVTPPHQCAIIHVSRSVKPADRFLTLVSSNMRTMSVFVSEVKNACNEFVTDVCTLIGDEEDYDDDTDSDYCDSDYSDSEIDPDSELTKKIIANEFEPIIANLKNMIQGLEQRYIAAKDAFNCCMSKEMVNFENPYPTIATGM